MDFIASRKREGLLNPLSGEKEAKEKRGNLRKKAGLPSMGKRHRRGREIGRQKKRGGGQRTGSRYDRTVVKRERLVRKGGELGGCESPELEKKRPAGGTKRGKGQNVESQSL